MKSYDHQQIERKWQAFWKQHNTFAADDNSPKEKFYALVEFPYPSGAGLHVGHVRSYAALDTLARKKRHDGKNVLYPIGWDAFGLPTENYAIKNKIHPAEATEKNIATFKSQMQALGLSYDWDREINTTDPKYYKWTQWIFLQLLKHGLAYKKSMPINWCTSCKIGLANEEVVDGACERCKGEVVKKEKNQWMLAITKYADRLIEDLDTVDFLDKIKAQQKNWIGKSHGAEVLFEVTEKKERDIREVFFPDGDEFENVFFVTWNTVSEKENLKNDVQEKDFIPGKKLLDSAQKQKAILRGLIEAEENANDSFCILESVVTQNHVHAVVWVDEADRLERVANRMKGVSSRRYFQQFSEESNAVNPPVYGRSAAVNGCVNNPSSDGEMESLIDKNDRSQFNHLWRNGYHFERIKTQADFEKTFEYLRSHEKKESHALFLGDQPVQIPVFTTRPDTLFGATYFVLAPEHPLVNKIVTDQQRDAVETYQKKAATESDLTRQEAKEKTGVFTGAHVTNPATGKPIPVWIADYVMMGYGTGAIMCVPAHDERDFEFAKKMNEKFGKNTIEIKKVVESEWMSDQAVKDGFFDRETFFGDKELSFYAGAKNGVKIMHSGGGWSFLGTDLEKIQKAINKYCKLGKPTEFNFRLYSPELPFCSDEGVVVNSKFLNNLPVPEAIEKIIAHLEKEGIGKKQTNYKLRDWVFSRQRYWGEPIPVVHCDKCGAVPLPESELPLELPDVKSYEPTDDGESPLARISDWVQTSCPTCGGVAQRETDTMPNWAGSSWYFLRYTDPHNDEQFAAPEKLNYWTPVDLYNGGMEHTTLHLLYSRFWHKFLFDQKLVPTAEPYKKRISHGMILAEDGHKMSKSFGNVINPNEIVEKYGADTLRLYEMFLGPFDQAIAWDSSAVKGIRRFLDKIWKEFQWIASASTPVIQKSPSVEQQKEKALHQTIKKVGEDIDKFKFNTAVAQMMSFVGTSGLRREKKEDSRRVGKIFCVLLSPFAPHLAEEIWHEVLGEKESLAYESWPAFAPKFLEEDTVTYAVQVNGKVRGDFEMSKKAGKEEVLKQAQALENVAKYLDGKEIVKEIFVPGRIVGFVVR